MQQTNTKILNTFWAENFTRFENRYFYGGTQLYWWQLPEFYDIWIQSAQTGFANLWRKYYIVGEPGTAVPR